MCYSACMIQISLREAFGLSEKTQLSFDHTMTTTAELRKRLQYLSSIAMTVDVSVKDALLDELGSVTDELWDRNPYVGADAAKTLEEMMWLSLKKRADTCLER